MYHPLLCLILLPLFFFFFFIELIPKAQSLPEHRAPNNTVSAIFVFGDSTSDPGNNNYIKTIFKGNFPPYGRDFVGQKPTGRFTNGRLASDYIISYVGIKDYVPPYLDPSLSLDELMTGVSFASAGSGFDPLTPTLSNVVSLPRQLEYFKEYRKRLEDAIGKERTEHHINRAIILISAGTNDFVVNYFTVPIRRKSYNVFNYQQFVIQHVKEFIQGLVSLGARKIAVVGLPPMGCLPIMITLNSDYAFAPRQCIDRFSAVAKSYDALLQSELGTLQGQLAIHGTRLYYADIYGPLLDMIQGYQRYGFEEVSSGCCGSGLLEAAFLCNRKSFVCSDATKYIFWDSIHPTEKAYYYTFQALRPIVDRMIKD
ncbi:hypothetical protein CRG98_035234 [Punica granatum]|uniref:GDSL esterase/lipase At5g45960-like n=1 Tax=Punica granatum TaxID=22663 RepID=A0A2I0IK53_PUNGR|nr:hypothetical protein CRG98_035234 [Punica granatum]